jgi:drug/metabolite transporter (DMT)-like permease
LKAESQESAPESAINLSREGSIRVLKVLPILAAILCWAAASLFVRFFSFRMDLHTQNFFRYLGASLLLGPVVTFVYPGCFRRFLTRWHIFLPLGAMLVAFQILWCASIYRIEIGFASLLGKVSTLLITLIAFTVHPEERRIIRSPLFLTGLALGFVGMAGVVAGIPNFSQGLSGMQKTGIMYLMGSAVVWAVYVNIIKAVLRTENSLQAITFICISTTVLYFPILLLWGHPGILLQSGAWLTALLLLSGMIGIAGANSSYYLSIKRIGLAPSSNLVLADTFVVALASGPLFGEHLSTLQWIFGLLLLAGCWLVVRVSTAESKTMDSAAARNSISIGTASN